MGSSVGARLEPLVTFAHQQADRSERLQGTVKFVGGARLRGHATLFAAAPGRPGRAPGAAANTTLGRQPSRPSAAC